MNKKRLLHIIMSNLHENWCKSGVGKNEKAYAWTDSEIAANALTEILYDLDCEEFTTSGSEKADYRRENIVVEGCWLYSFVEM